MNEAQETHVKAMAQRIESHAQAIVASMQALQRNNLLDMPVGLIEANFCDATHGSAAIQKVLTDMLPNVPH